MGSSILLYKETHFQFIFPFAYRKKQSRFRGSEGGEVSVYPWYCEKGLKHRGPLDKTINKKQLNKMILNEMGKFDMFLKV